MTFPPGVPESGTDIGEGAFLSCTNLTGLTLPGGLSQLGVAAFGDCTGLTSMVIPDSVTSISPWLLCGCYNLTNILIPSGVTNIGAHAFEYCSRLGTVLLPPAITIIDDYAFAWSGLTAITIPDSLQMLGNGAFQDCRYLTRVSGNCDFGFFIGPAAFYNCVALTNFAPGRVRNIGGFAFYGCTHLVSLTLDTVSFIGEHAFGACYYLNRIYFIGPPPTADDWAFGYGTTPAVLYYLPAYAGSWSSGLGNQPTRLWDPVIAGTSFSNGAFSCTVTGSPSIPIALEAAEQLNGPWQRIQTTGLAEGSILLHDPDSTNHPIRYYRIIGP